MSSDRKNRLDDEEDGQEDDETLPSPKRSKEAATTATDPAHPGGAIPSGAKFALTDPVRSSRSLPSRAAARSRSIRSRKTSTRAIPPSKSVESSSSDSSNNHKPSFVDLFSDDVLLRILQNLTSARDILSLSQTCRRLRRICADRSLWINVDARGATPMTPQGLRSIITYLHEDTRSIAISGVKPSSGGQQGHRTELPDIFEAVRRQCRNLEEIILEECYLENELLSSDLSGCVSLRSLRLPRTKAGPAFQSKSLHHVDCGVVDLSGCDWVFGFTLSMLGKWEKLQELTLMGCQPVSRDWHLSSGFEQLTKLDLRNTRVGWWEFVCLPKLTDLYLGFTSTLQAREMALRFQYQIRSDGDPELNKMLRHVRDQGGSMVRHLTMTHTEVTDASMGKLARRLPLEWLDVTGSMVTLLGAEEVRAERPGCEVVWGQSILAKW